MLLLLALIAVAAVVASALSDKLGRYVFLIPTTTSAIAATWFATKAPAIARGQIITEHLSWIPQLGVAIDLRLGAIQWLLAMVVTGVGALIFGYCAWYFESTTLAFRTVGLLTGFAASMLGLVLSDNLIVLFVFWELTTIFSYLLVGLNNHSAKNRTAAHTALIVTTIGGLAMLIGILMLGRETGTLSLAAISQAAPHTTWAAIAVALVLIGALSKSAIIPFQFWLPGAMAAPTPVSAFLHAAAMVKAGVFAIAVFTPAFADLSYWRPLLVGLGVATMLLGAWRALKQLDIKLLLAHGTVSQLGLLITIIGLGTQEALLAGLAMLSAHAVFKAALFMVVGVVDRATGSRDIRQIGGLLRQKPVVGAVAFLAAGSMAGVPPMVGFLAKEAGLEASFHIATGTPGVATWIGWVAFIGIALGAALTIAYTLRFIAGIFFGPQTTRCAEARATPWPMVTFPAILALAGVALGFAGTQISAVLHPAVAEVAWGEPAEHLALWHGITPALLATLVAMVLGVALWRWRGRTTSTEPGVDPFEGWFRRSLRAVDRVAVEITGRTQTGSLPLHVTTIFFVVLALPGGALLLTGLPGTRLKLADSIGQFVVAIAISIGAVIAANSRGRLKTFMLLSIVGYGTALLFLLHGAPDLALTQALCETVFLVLLVLVLRRLPKYFTERPFPRLVWVRATLGAAVGLTAVLITLAAANARTATPISERFYERAYDFGYGRNIVNVTLVDIRAWDTMGELSVLLVAATGVASLIFIRTRAADPRGTLRGDRGRPSTGNNRQHAWLRGARGLDEHHASATLEIITRLLFPVMILVSIYLLAVGHNLPGGGFAGGLVAGIAIALRYLAGGRDELADAAPFDAGKLLGAGVVTSASSMLWPLLIGGRIGESYAFDIMVRGLGNVHIVTTLLFDIGVWLIVVGAMLDFIRSLGAGIDVQAKLDIAPTPKRASDQADRAPKRRTSTQPAGSAS